MKGKVTRYHLFYYFMALLVSETWTSEDVLKCKRHDWINFLLVDNICLKDVQYLTKHLSDWSLSSQQLPHIFPLDAISRNYVRQVHNAIFSVVMPTPFRRDIKLGAVSVEALRDILDMHPSIVNSSGFLDVVSGNSVLPKSTPLAHRYGGHQFGVWAGQLGDGRAHLLGEYINQRGLRWELQLKGSGLTPYSRRGDGRAVIRSSVREFLASEAMFHLGLPTSRAVTLAVSKDRIMRDPFYNGHVRHERCAVVLRAARSWFRFGSLEILTDTGEIHLLARLVDFVIAQYFPVIDIRDPDRYLAFYSAVVSETAKMIAGWQGVGFAHGVCNTDNFSLLSITIDYGPFRFMDEYDPNMVPNTSDDEGRYRFQKQPDVGEFNLRKLLIALSPLLTPTQRTQMEIVLKGYKTRYREAWRVVHSRKLGILHCDHDTTDTVIELLLQMMADTRADFTMTFRQLGDWTRDEIEKTQVPSELWSLKRVSQHRYFTHWANEYWKCIKSSKQTDAQRRTLMHKTNPRYVLRNWIAQMAIAAAENDDFSIIEDVHTILKRPFEENMKAELSGYPDPPPKWANDLKVSCSS